MIVTEVKLEPSHAGRLRAYAHITLDDSLVLRDLRLIEGDRGPFVAMPSRKLTDRCPGCGVRNPLDARYCNGCGGTLAEGRWVTGPDGMPQINAAGNPRLFVDVAHPVNAGCRALIHEAIVDAYRATVR